MDYIKLPECEFRHIYKINSRNLTLGVYDGKNGFIGIRYKFGERYLFTEYHYDQGAPFGTVHPLEDVGILPGEIACTEDKLHEHGSLWRGDIPVIRRDLQPNEAPHGGRQGFVDLNALTNERLPENEYPHLRGNKELFEFLDKFKLD